MDAPEFRRDITAIVDTAKHHPEKMTDPDNANLSLSVLQYIQEQFSSSAKGTDLTVTSSALDIFYKEAKKDGAQQLHLVDEQMGGHITCLDPTEQKVVMSAYFSDDSSQSLNFTCNGGAPELVSDETRLPNGIASKYVVSDHNSLTVAIPDGSGPGSTTLRYLLHEDDSETAGSSDGVDTVKATLKEVRHTNSDGTSETFELP